jgi:oxygen-independent coproporphyrinogen-3 oxidase
MQRYHDALMLEIDAFADLYDQCVIPTLYLGGGTPSTWPDRLLLDMSGKIKSVFCIDRLGEVTIEVNPGTVSYNQLYMWRKCGINRLSIGVQYGDSTILAALNRFQTEEDVTQLLLHASREFDNVSVDIMLGLPGVDKSGWVSFMHKVVSWPVKHISLYCLMVHEQTPLYYNVKRCDVKIPDEGLIADLYCWSIDFLAQHGFLQYEVSNFARQGYESQHNIVYWDRKPYKGFGLGACSFDGNSRFMNEKNLMRYIETVEQKKDPAIFAELLSADDIRLEMIMLGLRRNKGISYNFLLEGLSLERRSILEGKIKYLCDSNLLLVEDGFLRLTAAGFVVEQEIIAELA